MVMHQHLENGELKRVFSEMKKDTSLPFFFCHTVVALSHRKFY